MGHDANTVPSPGADEAGAGCVVCERHAAERHARAAEPQGLRVAAAATAMVLLSGMILLLSRDDAAVSVEALLAQAGRGLREAGLGVDDEAEGARPLPGRRRRAGRKDPTSRPGRAGSPPRWRRSTAP